MFAAPYILSHRATLLINLMYKKKQKNFLFPASHKNYWNDSYAWTLNMWKFYFIIGSEFV